ncbi:alpha-1-acid glycoprotein 1-like [Equus przewalskii]|uniref:Lipocalin/cytosolic fatty-acid binding domain-containing protein n=2 Tax=Equus TaxID=9789 RepID=A0A9L0RS75_HORSE|nr:alpha-1-acid glycoprotein 2 [Equus caballus]XP_008509202.1 PREDICTED: alpha-1-acid glycoprotein 2-like [Equus przewalskii]
MALPWVLTVLSLLPLLDAQSPVCANFRASPITDATLDRISGKWFYIASAFRNPEYLEMTKKLQAAFFYLAPNKREDTIQLREYSTIGNQCIYDSGILNVQRDKGTLSKHALGREHVGYLWLTKDPRTFMILYFPDDKQNVGLAIYVDRPEVTQEQMSEFYESIACVGMDKSEIIYADEKQDQCGPLDKEHEEERKKKQEEA